MIILGVGCTGSAEASALDDLVVAVLAEAGVKAVDGIATLDSRLALPAIAALGERLGIAVQGFTAARLLEETPRLATPSEAAFRATGCWGIAEGAALAAAGSKASLLVTKRAGLGVTAALAKGIEP